MRYVLLMASICIGCAAPKPQAPTQATTLDAGAVNETSGATMSDLSAPTDVAAPPAEATTTQSGLAYRALSNGQGTNHPSVTDQVEVHYTGWTTDGAMFDSSVERGSTATFPLNGVIKGWTEGLQLMSPGDKFRFWIPANLAYGENPLAGRPKGMLVFDVELIAVE